MKFDLKNTIEKAGLDRKKTSFLLAVSGGPDSVFLFHHFLNCNLSFEVAHCNFQLRGDESDQEEIFVQNLCAKNQIPFHLKKFDTNEIAKENNESIQLTARNIRYAWFEEIMVQNNLEVLVTAHHLDDRIETFFLNLFRGTGINGLVPIPLFKGNRFRPLIELEKQEILDFLEKNKIDYKLDSSNESIKYSRNSIRLEMLPQIEKLFPDYRLSFRKNFERIEHVQEYVLNQKKSFLNQHLKTESGIGRISINSLSEKIHLQWLLEEYDGHFTHLKELEKLISSQKGKRFELPPHLFTRESDHISIRSLFQEPVNLSIEITEVPFENNLVEVRHESFIENFKSDEIYLDLEKINGPIIIRNWREGDRFTPLGMKGSKLISDFLTDRKIDSHKRIDTLVAESNSEIIGVLGFCCSNKYKIKSENCNILIIKLKEK